MNCMTPALSCSMGSLSHAAAGVQHKGTGATRSRVLDEVVAQEGHVESVHFAFSLLVSASVSARMGSGFFKRRRAVRSNRLPRRRADSRPSLPKAAGRLMVYRAQAREGIFERDDPSLGRGGRRVGAPSVKVRIRRVLRSKRR